MTIAINLSGFPQLAGNDFFYDYFVKFAASKPGHQFVFIVPVAMKEKLATSKNSCHVISSPRANNPLMWKIWLNYTLPAIARKHKADRLVNTGGVCSLRCRIPQCLFISNLSFLLSPQYFSKGQRYFFKNNMNAFLHKATAIVAASDFIAKEIIREYAIDAEKISRFQLSAGSLYQPIGFKGKEAVKEKYAEGKEYFLFSGQIHPQSNLVNLLRAFSLFKKRQKSNMLLIITANTVSANNHFIESIKTYKYREEVKLLVALPENDLAEITAAAYAFLYPVLDDGMALFPLQAMQCEVPVITTHAGAIPEKAGDAAQYVDATDVEGIADKMMLLFKDETTRGELIKKGKLQIQNSNKDKKDDEWWDALV